jgi:hypothetical protein
MTDPAAASHPISSSGFDAEVHPGVYYPRDFEFYEDIERRWEGVAVYGAIIFIGALVGTSVILGTWGYVGQHQYVSIALILVGIVILVVADPFLFVYTSGEVAFGGMGAGVTLLVSGGLVYLTLDPSGFVAVVALGMVGTVCMSLGIALARRNHRLSVAYGG